MARRINYGEDGRKGKDGLGICEAFGLDYLLVHRIARVI